MAEKKPAEFLTVKQVAQIMGYSEQTIRDWCALKSNPLRAVKMRDGNLRSRVQWRIPRTVLETIPPNM